MGRPGRVGAALLADEPPMEQPADDVVGVHAPDALDDAARDGLAVGDDRERLEGGRRQPVAVHADVARDEPPALGRRGELDALARGDEPDATVAQRRPRGRRGARRASPRRGRRAIAARLGESGRSATNRSASRSATLTCGGSSDARRRQAVVRELQSDRRPGLRSARPDGHAPLVRRFAHASPTRRQRWARRARPARPPARGP